MGVALFAGCGSSSSDDSQSASTTSPSAIASGSASASPKVAGEQVSPADLPVVVADRTFAGTYEGERYYEYYTPDGALRGESGGERYTGTWEAVGDELCFTYFATTGSPDEMDCYKVFRQGQDITWVGTDGEVITTTFEEGNPRGL